MSGPITKHPQGPWMGVRDAIIVAEKLLDAGYAPHVPHLSFYWDQERAPELREERGDGDWMAIDLAVVPRCDALLRLPGYSAGGDQEVEAAERSSVPVYHDLDELLDYLPSVLAARDYHQTTGKVAVTPAESIREELLQQIEERQKPAASSVPGAIKAALDKIRGTFEKKNADYADDSRTWDSNFRDVSEQMGWDGPLEACEALIAVKQARLRSMRNNGRLPNNESVEDTILDRAVYSVIALGLSLQEEGE